jgi:hypothetical protein
MCFFPKQSGKLDFYPYVPPSARVLTSNQLKPQYFFVTVTKQESQTKKLCAPSLFRKLIVFFGESYAEIHQAL